MTFLIDPPMFMAIGALNAILSRRRLIARNPRTFGPSAWASVGYAVFFWAIVTWSVVYSPDWMLAYTVPATDLPLVVVHLLFLVVLVTAALSGHTMAAVALQRDRNWTAVAVLITALVIWFGLWGLTLDRYMVMGTFQQWLDGTAVPIIESDMSTAINVMGIVDVFGWVIPTVLLVRMNMRLKPA